ncbi:MAG: glutathionylspermidine amidase/synthetase [Halothiobacillaceae bacterium]|nr:MAG: glutathionylspermidine amidase/synthetase [Halothiobacillaceae bacterium]
MPYVRRPLLYSVLFLGLVGFLGLPLGHADVPLPAACQRDCVAPYGERLGADSSGIPAYSNCSANCFVPQPNREQGTYTGIRWQCVEYARRWLLKNHGVVYGDVDVAADLWSKIDHVTRVTDQAVFPLTTHANGNELPPKKGDLLIYTREYLGTGHVAVVTEVDLTHGTLAVAEQNFLNRRWPAGHARTITLVTRDGRYWALDAYLLGWKRPVLTSTKP